MNVRTRPPKTPEEFQSLWSFRYRVTMASHEQQGDSVDHERKWIRDPLDEGATNLIALHADDEIVGCLRVNWVQKTSFPQVLRARLELDRLESLFGRRPISCTSMFMVDPSTQGEKVAKVLILKLLEVCGGQSAVADICSCELSMVHTYQQIGYRPYAETFHIEGMGARVPMILCLGDQAYLKKIGSDIASCVPHSLDDKGRSAEVLRRNFPCFQEPVLLKNSPQAVWSILPAGPPPDDPRKRLFGDIPEIAMDRLLAESTTLDLDAGARLFGYGETERGMALILSGRVGIYLTESPSAPLIAVRGPGECIGELLGLGITGRSAFVNTLEPTRILLLPFDFIERAGKQDPETGFRLAFNMCRILARNIAEMSVFVRRASLEEDADSSSQP